MLSPVKKRPPLTAFLACGNTVPTSESSYHSMESETVMRVSVLGLGEAGSLYAAGLVERGWTVTGYDPADIATPVGVTRTDTPDAAVHGADVVLSLVGGKA